MSQLVIADISIRQDAEGRYCLNDLHKAAGSESRHQPGKWLENKQTHELIAEFEKTGIPVIHSKQGVGTFVHKELVYDYAMWISAAFKIKVIRAYDAMVTEFNIPKTLPEALRLAADIQEKLDQANLQIEQDKPKVDFAMAVRNMQGACSVGEFAKTIGIGRNKLFKKMRDGLILMRNNIPYQRYIDQGLFVVIEQIPYTDSKGKTHPAFTTMITGKGQVFLEKKYRDGFA